MTKPAGYSGKSVSSKLGIPAGPVVVLGLKPSDYPSLVGPLPAATTVTATARTGARFIHLFATSRETLATKLAMVRSKMASDGTVWISWPKKASKVATDITEDVIREVAFPLGLVDIKVCAVSEVWSGLKLMIRKDLRAPPKS